MRGLSALEEKGEGRWRQSLEEALLSFQTNTLKKMIDQRMLRRRKKKRKKESIIDHRGS